ncbi:hypothetical protein GOODEAATRI_023326 [Goodea atripinnis]|uniref:Uncharacterized protein n=1 Tax=Goodea atripinnis TaxID=208336 RepID=A0ABV0N3S2_9TELE
MLLLPGRSPSGNQTPTAPKTHQSARSSAQKPRVCPRGQDVSAFIPLQINATDTAPFGNGNRPYTCGFFLLTDLSPTVLTALSNVPTQQAKPSSVCGDTRTMLLSPSGLGKQSFVQKGGQMLSALRVWNPYN